MEAPIGWHPHENGGGLVQDTATVAPTAYVGPDALVYGDAWVLGDAHVLDDARVYGNARLFGDAWVSGNARLFGDAHVLGDAWLSGNARVFGDAWVVGDAWEASPPQMVIGRWYGHMRDRCTVAIGCQTCDVSDDLHAWVRGLAEEYEATEAEKRAALVFVDWCRAEMGVSNGG